MDGKGCVLKIRFERISKPPHWRGGGAARHKQCYRASAVIPSNLRVYIEGFPPPATLCRSIFESMMKAKKGSVLGRDSFRFSQSDTTHFAFE